MRALQRIFGSHIVIKIPADPRCRVVTLDTGRAKHTIMEIITLVAATAGVQRVVESTGEMATLTGQRLVGSGQWKLSEIVAENQIQIPGRLAMTLLAILAQFPLVRICRPMTVCADPRFGGFLDRSPRGVTAGTNHIAMGPYQLKVSISPVIKFDCLPTVLRVAACAIRTVCSPVDIICSVAISTGRGQAQRQSLAMACLASHLPMPPPQRKFGLAPVVEANRFPGFRYMTGAALATEYTEVSVLAQVAGHAFGRRALERLIYVTSGTLRIRVSALERKVGARMVEGLGLPTCFRVAH